MKHLNKLFLIGFRKTNILNEFFKDNNLEILDKKNYLIDKAIKENTPILYFAEKYSVFSGDWIVSYLDEIDKLYPYSKFILNISNSSEDPTKWSINKRTLSHFFIDDSSLDRFLLSKQVPDKYSNIKKDFNSDFSNERFMLFDEKESDFSDLLNFINHKTLDFSL
tara:strand:- start:219 stop:713 length:495 start_codon:yes stop_codon:yes gene_type:complete